MKFYLNNAALKFSFMQLKKYGNIRNIKVTFTEIHFRHCLIPLTGESTTSSLSTEKSKDT